MEIRQLKYFLKVAETLNFSEASRKLYITQSTLSQQISHLEQEIGLPLFERNSHEVYLTEAGKELRPYAQNAVNSAEACVDHMNDLKEMLTGELNIGVTFSFSNIMSETLIAFLHAYPHVKLNIQYRTMQELMDGLKKRELDLVLAFKPLKNEKAVDSRAIFSNRLAAIVNENHPLARLSSVKLSDLERYDLILPCKGLQARNAFDHMVEGKDLNYKIMVEVNNVNIIFDLLSRSNLVTILSESTTILQNGMKAIPIDAADNEMEPVNIHPCQFCPEGYPEIIILTPGGLRAYLLAARTDKKNPRSSSFSSEDFFFFLPFYPFFLAMIIVTPARIARMPIASCREKLSPKTHMPMMTAVTGSKAPMMAAGVLPIRLMEMVMKKSDNTVGNKASWAAQSHCLGV